MIHVVDTHSLVRYLADFETLGAQAQQILNAPTRRLVLPTIVLAEALYMIAKARIDLRWNEITAAIDADLRFAVYPLTVAVIERVPTHLEMHDGIVVATALHLRDTSGEEVVVITRDRRIRDSGLIDTIW